MPWPLFFLILNYIPSRIVLSVNGRTKASPTINLRETRKEVTKDAKVITSVKGAANSVDVRKVDEKATAAKNQAQRLRLQRRNRRWSTYAKCGIKCSIR